MRALTVRQPYAWAIAHGYKTTENRARSLGGYTGQVLLHAARTWDQHGAQDQHVLEAFDPFLTGRQRDRESIDPAEHSDRFAFGAVIAVLELVSTHRAEAGCCWPWGQPDAFHLTIRVGRLLDEPVPARGLLGLWTPPAELLAAVA